MKLSSRTLVSTFFALMCSLTACSQSEGPVELPSEHTTDAERPPAALSWESTEQELFSLDLGLGDQATVTDAVLRESLLELRGAFPAWGAGTLAWHLLDGGLAEAALLHAALPEKSQAALALAEAAAARIEGGENFFAVLQERPESEPPAIKQPSPFALGARVAARAAAMDVGEWSGPLRTKQGWEIIYVEERVPGIRSRAGLTVRRVVFPVGEDVDRTQARTAWAKLTLSGHPALLRALPRALVRDRMESTP